MSAECYEQDTDNTLVIISVPKDAILFMLMDSSSFLHFRSDIQVSKYFLTVYDIHRVIKLVR